MMLPRSATSTFGWMLVLKKNHQEQSHVKLSSCRFLYSIAGQGASAGGLAVTGGAIGVVYAVLAYMLNIKIYQSTLSKLNKVLANLLCGMSALSGWWFSAQLIQGQLF